MVLTSEGRDIQPAVGIDVPEPSMREEARQWFGLALPMAATLLCRTGMMLTDVSVLGLWNSDYLGAAGVATVFLSLTSVVV